MFNTAHMRQFLESSTTASPAMKPSPKSGMRQKTGTSSHPSVLRMRRPFPLHLQSPRRLPRKPSSASKATSSRKHRTDSSFQLLVFKFQPLPEKCPSSPPFSNHRRFRDMPRPPRRCVSCGHEGQRSARNHLPRLPRAPRLGHPDARRPSSLYPYQQGHGETRFPRHPQPPATWTRSSRN